MMGLPPDGLLLAREKLFRQLILEPALRVRDGGLELTTLEKSVRSVEIGPRTQDDQRTGEWAVRVRVTRKLADVPPAERVPESIDGFPTDVISSGAVRIENAWTIYANPCGIIDRKTAPGLIGGLCIGNFGKVVEEAPDRIGTAGAVVRKEPDAGLRFLLTNWHVIAAPEDAPYEQRVVQPANLEGDTIGTVSEQSPVRFPCDDADKPNALDAALVVLDSAKADSSFLVNHIGLINGLRAADTELIELLRRPTIVTKSGAATGQTYGVLDGIHVGVRVEYARRQTAIFDGQLAIVPLLSTGPDFTDAGDSGALVVLEMETGNAAVGLHFAGAEHVSYATPIGRVVEHFRIRFS